jgi:ribosomal protein S6
LKKKPELIKSIKRGAELIIKKNGVIREFQNLGFKSLPYKIKAQGGHHTHGK